MLLFVSCFLAPKLLFGQGGDTLDDQTRTAYLKTDYGLTTYKSKLLLSNDTGSALSYGIGAYVGDEKHWGIGLKNESSTTKFLLVSSAVKASLQDITISYRWGYMYLGAVISTAGYIVTKDGATLFDASGSGYGGNFGFLIPITRTAIVYLDVTTASISKTIEASQKSVSLGSRTDIDLGASVDITKRVFDFIFGYRQRSHKITFLGAPAAETRTATYIGFQMGADF